MPLIKRLLAPVTYLGGVIISLLVWGGMALGVSMNRKRFSVPSLDEAWTQTIIFSNGCQFRFTLPKPQNNYSEHEDIIRIDLASEDKFEQQAWQRAHMIRCEGWHYGRFIPMTGGGEDGELIVSLSLNQCDDMELSNFIIASYQNYYNGPEGSNTELRQSEMGEGLSDEELGDWLVKVPHYIETTSINGSDYSHWCLERKSGYSHIYYAYGMRFDRYFLIEFRFRGCADSKLELINEIMSRATMQLDNQACTQ